APRHHLSAMVSGLRVASPRRRAPPPGRSSDVCTVRAHGGGGGGSVHQAPNASAVTLRSTAGAPKTVRYDERRRAARLRRAGGPDVLGADAGSSARGTSRREPHREGRMSTPMDRETFIERTVDWINRTLVPPDVTIDADTSLFADGLINSIRILRLIAWT